MSKIGIISGGGKLPILIGNNLIKKKYEVVFFVIEETFDKQIYSNLNTISFWSIENEIKLLEERGYSTKPMETKLQRSFAFPFFPIFGRSCFYRS